MEARTEGPLLILADISGHAKFMLASRVASVTRQQAITALTGSILAEVEGLLNVEEIEGDAVFL